MEGYREELHVRRIFTASGVDGRFRSRFGKTNNYVCEVASVYAEVAHRLGYLAVVNTLAKDEWRIFRSGLRHKCRSRNWRVSEVTLEFGAPSLLIGHMVFAYVPQATERGWVCFDFDCNS
ncbi:MAG TPA: hypothetical protein VGZ25_09270, partial [Gemmataceae bacterium]|nr:hypothetical protein [Gemmataceae bacterium]